MRSCSASLGKQVREMLLPATDACACVTLVTNHSNKLPQSKKDQNVFPCICFALILVRHIFKATFMVENVKLVSEKLNQKLAGFQ